MKYSKKNIIQALKDARGVLSVAAESLGCTRKTIYNRMSDDEEIEEARDQAREGMIDTAENAIHNLVTNPDHKDHYKAVRYYLTTQGARRGYNDKLELDHVSSDGSMSPPSNLQELYDAERSDTESES